MENEKRGHYKKISVFCGVIVSTFFVTSSLFARVTVERLGIDLPGMPRSVQISHDDPSIINVSMGEYGVYKSTDGGNTFYENNTGLPVTENSKGYVSFLEMSKVNPNRMFVNFSGLSGNQLYYTENGGGTWKRPSTMDNNSLINDIVPANFIEINGRPIALNPIDEKTAISAGMCNSLQKTEDGGGSWTYSGDKFTGGTVGSGSSSFCWDNNDSGRFLLFLKDYGAVITENHGVTFKNLNVPIYNDANSTMAGALDPTPGSDVIVTAVGNRESKVIAVTRDNGENWSLINGTDGNHKFVAFHSQDADIIYVSDFKSMDNGLTWNVIERPVEAMFHGDGDVVYSTERDGVYLKVYKSIDRGESWLQPYDDVDIGDTYTGNIAIDPDDQDRLYVTTSNGLYLWNGSQWSVKTVKDGLGSDKAGDFHIRCVTVDPNNPDIVYVGVGLSRASVSNGIFMSIDRGDSWQNITFNLGQKLIPLAISVDPHTGYLYVGSFHGTWFMSPKA